MNALIASHHPVCYPSDPESALSFFRDAIILGRERALPAAPAGRSLAGIITPHIDFRVSLPAYAAAFQPLWNEPLAETYLVLGVGHRSHLEWNLDTRDYETPLGRVNCVREFVDILAAGTNSKRLFSAGAHEGEHSIEFPLLWLQALHQQSSGKEARAVHFVPILCGGLHEYVDGRLSWDELGDFHRLSAGLAALFQLHPPGEKLRIVVSIDGCHMGPRFQHPYRVTPKLLKATAAWENEVWACVADGDVRKFLDWFRSKGNDRYFDGVGALALLMAAFSEAKIPLAVQRTYYEQWFTDRDASVVTFSSGRILR